MADTNRADPKLAHARLLISLLPQMEQADVVYAVMPDGEELLIKGRRLLEHVVESGRSKTVTQAKIPVLEIECAAVLEQELGNDGKLVRRIFGDTLVGGPIGNA